MILPVLSRRPFLGVKVASVTDSVATLNRLAQPQGALVVRMILGCTASTLALQPGDVIVQVNDHLFIKSVELPLIARSLRTGD